MNTKVLQFCREQDLIPAGSTVTCAVSGGADSMALLRCLLDLQETLEIRICAAHFNHRLRGEEADRDADFVRNWCLERNIPFHAGCGDVAAYAEAHRCGTEEAARILRYEFLERLPGLIATAHTADDHAETVLMNLIRGTGLKGLCGIPVRRGTIIRPLLSVTREDVLNYLEQTGTPWREDSSNAGDAYRRNRIRHHVMPLLRAENPSLARTMLYESQRLRAEDAYLDAEARKANEAARRADGWDCAALASLPEAIQRRVLLQIMQESGDAHHVEKLRALVCGKSPTGQTVLPRNRLARKAYGLLRILTETPPPLGEYLLPIPGTAKLTESGLTVHTNLYEKMEDFSGFPDTILLNYDMINDTILVRARRTGDVITLSGGRRSLKRLMIDRKIPQEQRDRIPVLTMGEQVLAVYGVGTDCRFFPQVGCRILAIAFDNE